MTGAFQESGHYGRAEVYWFRGNGCGDDERPRCDEVSAGWRRSRDTDTEADSFRRALEKCRQLGWPPLVLVKGKVVAYKEQKEEV